LDDTIIIYTSDHGCSLGHHGFWGKGNSTRPLNMYDTSLRIPLIWRGPGIEAGPVIADNVDHYDTFQTVLALAGIEPDDSRRYPGTAYHRQLRGERIEWDQTRYGEYGDLRMIRTPEWKLVYRYPDGPHDLFHLQTDPGETRNVYDDPAQRAIIADLKARLDTFYARYEDPQKSGLRVKDLPRHNDGHEAWRDGRREARGLQVY
jgi:arylsulfatase A-like enzyme